MSLQVARDGGKCAQINERQSRYPGLQFMYITGIANKTRTAEIGTNYGTTKFYTQDLRNPMPRDNRLVQR